jgi:hypothetical protein
VADRAGSCGPVMLRLVFGKARSMTPRLAILVAAALALPGGAALAQAGDQPSTNFYGDPVLPDPPLKAAHVFPASLATEDVAAVAPAAGAPQLPQRATACTALNPCAVTARAAR